MLYYICEFKYAAHITFLLDNIALGVYLATNGSHQVYRRAVSSAPSPLSGDAYLLHPFTTTSLVNTESQSLFSKQQLVLPLIFT